MSKGEWWRCPYTGIPLKTLARVSDDYLTEEGFFRVDLLHDCNLFGVRSISAAFELNYALDGGFHSNDILYNPTRDGAEP